MNLDDAFERYMDELCVESDLIPVPTKIRAIRRHHTDRIFIKTLKQIAHEREFYWWRHLRAGEYQSANGYHAAKKRMNNRAMCSRQCCSKTRHAKWRGGNSVLAVTLQERRVRITLLEELNCPSWTEADNCDTAWIDERFANSLRNQAQHWIITVTKAALQDYARKIDSDIDWEDYR